ncbi:peroxiredoxin family protein [Myxococcus sp. Y35]|uniref:peroxiredoxin family protein n=1 Tax=Pseudomyxococcus flavus TaxID=3115648 RepID=UPI003CEAAB0E
MKAWIAGALSVSLAAGSALGAAPAPAPSPTPVDATLKTSSGKEVRLSKWRGKPVILFYEDKDSTKLNATLKKELFARGQERGILDAAWVLAVANLQSFDFFPARQIALSFVRDEEKKVGVPILVDMDGTMGKAPWKLPVKTSNVVLLDAEGALVYRHSGRMKPDELTAFFAVLSRLVGVDLNTPVPTEPTP